MQENTEDKMFQQLLGDYAAPAEDNGFSDLVLSSLPQPRNTRLIKSVMVGGAGAIGAVIASAKLPALWAYVSGVKLPALPTVETPTVNMDVLANSSLLSSPYAPALLGVIVLSALWMGQVVIFGDDV
jgi:hypothetical protein